MGGKIAEIPDAGKQKEMIMRFIVVILMMIAASASASTSRSQVLRMLGEMEFIEQFTGQRSISTTCIGQSVLGRNIPLVAIHDPQVPIENTRRIFVICRQHGDEPASTEAMIALIKSYFSHQRQEDLDLLKKVTLIIVPFMNPDGAARFKRRNANNADLNRDWTNQRQPETRAVIAAIRAWNPDLVIDGHELNRNDHRRDFIECLGTKSHIDPQLVYDADELRSLIIGQLRMQGYLVDPVAAAEPALSRLAHRYIPRKHGIVTLLIETRQAGRRAKAIDQRMNIHRAAVMTSARCLAGYTDEMRLEIAEWRENHTSDQLAYRGKRNRQYKGSSK
jgi:hypothetical protein